MQLQEDGRTSTVRALLELTGTPFRVATYRQREVIFSQGDPCYGVMHIEKGRVWLAVSASSGREAIVDLLSAGAFMGEDAICGNAVRRETATAMSATEVIVVEKAQMIRLLRTQQELSDRFIAHVLARHFRLEASLTDQLLKSSEQRLARTLLVLAGCGKCHPCRCVLPHISQEIIAEMVGTTRSRVNTFMSKFKKLGFIENDGRELLVTPFLLQVVHGGIMVSQTEHSQGSSGVMFEQRHWPQAGRS